MFFVESSVTTHMCPICQATLRYRDSRPRIRRKEGGLKDQLIIRRFYCKNCHSYHNERKRKIASTCSKSSDVR